MIGELISRRGVLGGLLGSLAIPFSPAIPRIGRIEDTHIYDRVLSDAELYDLKRAIDRQNESRHMVGVLETRLVTRPFGPVTSAIGLYVVLREDCVEYVGAFLDNIDADEKAAVRVRYGEQVRDYSMDEFLQRLGFRPSG